ncbi:MAG: hypothetical protein OEM63_00045 [Gammaproteobacteria bacterium]|nr:hypothetical protein [Gammaproteobacteria bacterium]
MTIEQKYIDLINAEMDDEISAEDQALLDAYIAQNADARALRDELAELGNELSGMEPLMPPADLRHPVMRQVRTVTDQAITDGGISEMLAGLFGLPLIRYGMSFAAGVVLTVTLIGSDQASRQAFEDVTNLVGTMSDTETGGALSSGDSMMLALNELAGSVSLNSAGPLMVLDFDLASATPVEIVATFDNRDIWFNGFAQLESQGTSVSAGTGSVTVRMEGQRRYAVYLHNASQDAATVNLRFVAAGETLHEGQLRFAKQN